MKSLVDLIWQRWHATPRGRFLAGALIGGLLGVTSALTVYHEGKFREEQYPKVLVACAVASLFMGGFASLFLESRDENRPANPDWQQRVERTAAEIRAAHPEVPPPLARQAATNYETKRHGWWVWIPIGLTLLGMLIGVVSFFLKFLGLLRP